MESSKSGYATVPINELWVQKAQPKSMHLIRRAFLGCFATISIFTLLLIATAKPAMAQNNINNTLMLPFFSMEGETQQLEVARGQKSPKEFAFKWDGTADPTARVFDGVLYVYTSTDSRTACGNEKLRGQQGFCMPGYQLFSTKNMKDWTEHGTILTQDQVPWAESGSARMWAPDVIKKGGKYYLFFPAPTKGGGHQIGVAVADKPTGPFVAQSKPIDKAHGIDPSVIAIRNRSDKSLNGFYMFTAANRTVFVQKIDNQFTKVIGDSKAVTGIKTQGYAEGPFAFKRNGKLLLHYSYTEGQYTLQQAVARDPNNPFSEFTGSKAAVESFTSGTNHGSVVSYKGKSWYFYHKHTEAKYLDLRGKNFGKYRRVYYRQVFFKKDGFVKSFKPAEIPR